MIPNGSTLFIGEILTVVFTVTPNHGAGVSYPVRSYLNGSESSNTMYMTNGDGQIALQQEIAHLRQSSQAS